MYRVGSEATGQTKVQFLDPAVDYGLHAGMQLRRRCTRSMHSLRDPIWTAPADRL